MKPNFSVEIEEFSIIEELPKAWIDRNYRELLEEMDIDGISEFAPEELKEMCLISLTDNDPADAAKIVLKYIFKDRLTSGQIDNMANEMLDEKLWEEYADLSMHEELFNAAQLLYVAFKGTFPHPKVVSFTASVKTRNPDDFSIFESDLETPLIRLLIQGMPETTLIHRLFDDKLEEGSFEEAKDIIWQLKRADPSDGKAVTFHVISSLYWFHDLEDAQPFEAALLVED